MKGRILKAPRQVFIDAPDRDIITQDVYLRKVRKA